MREIRPLTTLRALAALLVFLYHYAVLHAPGDGAGVPLRAVWAHGYMGVPIFFVLSGFLITRLYFDALRTGRVTLRTFLVKRIARIWPLFLVLAAVQHLGAWLLGRGEPGLDWLVTLSMSQGWFAGLLYDGLSPAWSLTIEEAFYVLVPAFCLVIDRLVFRDRRTTQLGRRAGWRLVGALALLVIGLAAAGEAAWRLSTVIGLDWRGFLGDRDHVLRMTLFGRMPEFAVGMLVAFLHRDGRILTRLGARAAGILAVACLVIMGALMASKEIAPPVAQYLAHLGVTGAAGVLVVALCVPGHVPGRVLSLGPLVYLGRVSYAFYLIQLSVLVEPLSALVAGTGPWRLPLLYLGCNALCAALFELVEKPARRSLVRRWSGF